MSIVFLLCVDRAIRGLHASSSIPGKASAASLETGTERRSLALAATEAAGDNARPLKNEKGEGNPGGEIVQIYRTPNRQTTRGSIRFL